MKAICLQYDEAHQLNSPIKAENPILADGIDVFCFIHISRLDFRNGSHNKHSLAPLRGYDTEV